MRIERLDLARYGAFTDRSVEFGERREGCSDLHVVFGPNEAGKSTLFSAWMALLYGVPSKAYAFRHDPESLEIRARLQLPDGTVELARAGCAKRGRLLDAEGRSADPAILSGALRGLDERDFATMFSLDAAQLEEGGNAILSSDGRLGELLFSGGSGLAGVGEILATAREDAKEFFVPGGSARQLNKLKTELAELEEKLAETDTNVSEHRKLIAARDEAHEAHLSAVREFERAQRRGTAIRQLLDAMVARDERDEADERLAALGELPEAPPEWKALAATLATEAAELKANGAALAERRRRLDEEAGALQTDDAALAVAEALDALREPHGEGQPDLETRMKGAVHDLPRRETRLSEIDTEVAATLRAIGLDTETGVAAGDCLLPLDTASRIRSLAAERDVLRAALESAAEERAESERALEAARRRAERASEAAGSIDAGTHEVLLARVRRLRRDGLEPALDHAERRLESARAGLAGRLPSDPGSALEALRSLPPISPARVEEWRGASSQIDRREAERRAALEALDREAAGLGANRGGYDVPSDEEARQARATRDEAWTEHRRALEAGEDAKATGETFGVSMRADDALTARRLDAATRLAELRAGERRLAVISAEREVLERSTITSDERTALRARVAAALAPYAEAGLARGTAIEPLFESDRASIEIAAVADWVEAHRLLVREAAELSKLEADRDAAAAALEREHEALAATLAPLDLPGTEGFGALLDAAEAWLARSGSLAEEARRGEEAVQQAEAALERRAATLDAAKVKLADWANAWTEAVGSTFLAGHRAFGDGIDPDTRTVVELLDRAISLETLLTERRAVERQILTMRADVASFLEALARIASALGLATPDMASWAEVDRAARRRVELARNAASQAERLATQRGEIEDEEERHGLARAAHTARLAEMSERLETDDPARMMPLLDRIAQRDAVRLARDAADRRIAHCMRGLAEEPARELASEGAIEHGEPSTDGLDGLDRDALGAEGGRLSSMLPRLAEERDEAAGRLAVADSALGRVGGDDAAARLASARQALKLEIESGARRMLALEFGVEAAARALHRYRETHRSDMLERASDAFAAMSCGSFSGLETLPDLNDEKLAAVRPDGSHVRIQPEGRGKGRSEGGLSKGTRHQLYLALRIAGYHELAAARTPPPFMCDDVLETFDDGRSAATLKLLGEMSQRGQVIVLTHHEHMLDLARRTVPGVRCHRLDSEPDARTLAMAAE